MKNRNVRLRAEPLPRPSLLLADWRACRARQGASVTSPFELCSLAPSVRDRRGEEIQRKAGYVVRAESCSLALLSWLVTPACEGCVTVRE
jgi:hypothetical protein